jgi:DNA-binding NarL/FixJ family response regulator
MIHNNSLLLNRKADMDQIVILDRQPMLRLGLKLLLTERYHSCDIYEARNYSEFCDNQPCNDVSIFILGLDMENDTFDLRLVRSIKRKFPKARLVIYADQMESMSVVMCFRNGISAYISKQSSETELVECLQSVSCNKRYLTYQFFTDLKKDVGQYFSYILPQMSLYRRSMKYKTT